VTEARRTVTWQQFAVDAAQRCLVAWMTEECLQYGVLLQEVFDRVGPHEGRRSVRHARARIFRRLVDDCRKSYPEVAAMFGVHSRVVARAVEGHLGYLAGEAKRRRSRLRSGGGASPPEAPPLRVDGEEFMKP
jgi:hypothetical protein